MIQALTARIDELEKRPADTKITSKLEPPKTAEEDTDKKDKKKRRGATVKGGMTALLFAARDGKMDAAKALVELGADIDDAGAGEKMTPLVMAIANGHYDLAKYLLDRGADPNLASIEGLTALYAVVDMQWAPYAWRPQPVAAQEHISYLDLMRALVEHGADPNARLKQRVWFRSLPGDHAWVDPAGATAFWRAAQSDDVDAMRLLVKAGADPKLPTTEGVTPLMVAGGLGWAANFSRNAPDSWMEAVKYCLELGNDVNAKNAKGYTALHGAAFIGNNDLIGFLMDKGADVHAVSKDKNTVADMANGPIAHSNLHPDTIALLEKLGSENSHNCRSDSCLITPLITPKEEKEKAKVAPH
jgi:ankyrin repeat protein